MAGLEGTVDVPVAGKLPKRELAIGGVVVGGLIIVYYVRRRSSSSATASTGTAAAATSTDQYPPDGTVGNPSDPYSTDSATGQTYGNEAAGSGGTYGAFGSGASSGLYYDPATGAYDLTSPYGTSSTTTGTSGPPFSSNSAWENWVIQQLQTNDPGINVGELQTALGLYLDGQPVTAAQKVLILDATATGGNPPVAGTNGYPPNVRTNGGKGGHTQATVPDVVGKRLDDARPELRRAGFGYNVSDTEEGTVTGQSPKGGSQANEGSTVRLTVKRDAVKHGPVGKK